MLLVIDQACMGPRRRVHSWNFTRVSKTLPDARAKSAVKFALTGLCVVFLVACAAPSTDRAPLLRLEGTSIENQTEMWVSAARLLVPSTGNFVSCGNIPPGSKCSTTFPEIGYTANPVEITWSQGGQIYSTGQFVLQLPTDVDYGKPALVSILIAEPGKAGAVIVQNPD